MTMLPMQRLDSFTYLDTEGKTQTVDLTLDTGAKCVVDVVGIHYAPLAGVINDPLSVLIPWGRVLEVFYRP